jgi:redox-sensitive bicupin YhaK (pirin superfamily)
MSAGTGVQHSEFNQDAAGKTQLLQIWIMPARAGMPPSYEQKSYTDTEKRGQLRLVVSPDGRDGSVTIHQNASIYAGLFDVAERATLPIASGRLAYAHVARGAAVINGKPLQAGDALLYSNEAAVSISDGQAAEVLVFDLPAL